MNPRLAEALTTLTGLVFIAVIWCAFVAWG